MYDPLRAKAKVALAGGLTFFLGLGIASGLGWTKASQAMPVVDEKPALSVAAIKPAQDLSDAFVNISDVVTPAVVRIESRKMVRQTAREESPQNLFRFFSPDQPDQGQGQGQGRRRQQQQLQSEPEIAGGSGFIVSPDGYILTNDHVVSGADQVTVYLRDRRVFDAKVVGSDPFTDVAVIKISVPGQLPHLSFGNSEEVKVGQWVLAVGNPGFGSGSQLDYTVTQGIVSARGRGLGILNRGLQEQYGNDPNTQQLPGYAIEDFIQTDAVINPGNSGGPMVNLLGQVVGINSAIATNTGYYQGYGFAIPINLARHVMEDLVEFGTVHRPLLGVSMGTVSPEDADAYGLPAVAGVLVQPGFPPNSPAAAAGVKAGDVITAVDGKSIGYAGNLQERIAEHRPGDRVKVTVFRNKHPLDIDVKLGEAPINNVAQHPVEAAATADERLGIKVETLDAQTAKENGFKDAGGVVITDVQPGSAAERRGIVPGLKVTQIDGKPVTNPDDVRRALAAVKGGQVVSLVLATPQGNPTIVNVRMPGR